MSPATRRITRFAFFFLLFVSTLLAKESDWFTRQTEWHGFDQFHFQVAERNAYLVAPKKALNGNPWIWRARFPGYHAEMDVALVKRGYHIGYVDVAGMLGSPKAIAIGDAFYDFMTTKRGMATKPALEGVSRGGLLVYNWAAKNPDKVACIYCDTPVCDIKSWPGGKGNGLGSKPTWKQCLSAYGFSEKQAVAFDKNPIDHAEILAKANIPLLHIVSETDRVVPPDENTYLLRDRLAKFNHSLDVISVPVGTEKSNGHHFDHPQPERVVKFIVSHSSGKPFVEYPEPTASYLKRLHRPGGKPSQSKLAFRADYPGGFAAWQRDARAKLTELLGLDLMQQQLGAHQPTVRLEEEIPCDGYQRRLGHIETEPGVTIPFWILIPSAKTDKPKPLILCAHGHDSIGWKTYAGDYEDEKHRTKTESKQGDVGVQAVKRGYVAIVLATRGLATAASVPNPKNRHGERMCRAQLMHCLLAGRTAVGERVWDTQRVLDWALANVDGIDPKAVVMMGNSGGGVLTVYAAAMDERIQVAIPSCSFSSFASASGYIFHCDCCLVPRAASELGDMADIGALTAPRNLLAVHGRKDGLHHAPDVDAAMRRVREIYAAAKAADKFQHRWGEAGHKFYPEFMWPFVEDAVGASE